MLEQELRLHTTKCPLIKTQGFHALCFCTLSVIVGRSSWRQQSQRRHRDFPGSQPPPPVPPVGSQGIPRTAEGLGGVFPRDSLQEASPGRHQRQMTEPPQPALSPCGGEPRESRLFRQSLSSPRRINTTTPHRSSCRSLTPFFPHL